MHITSERKSQQKRRQGRLISIAITQGGSYDTILSSQHTLNSMQTHWTLPRYQTQFEILLVEKDKNDQYGKEVMALCLTVIQG
jgi:hypothetical protein